jgi:hypothetical protein
MMLASVAAGVSADWVKGARRYCGCVYTASITGGRAINATLMHHASIDHAT